MSTSISFAETIAVDALVRVTIVMGIAYLLAWSVRRVAAVRHAILLTGLVAAIVVPGAMLVLQATGVPLAVVAGERPCDEERRFLSPGGVAEPDVSGSGCGRDQRRVNY